LLLVDDDPDVAKAVSVLLGHAGMEVAVAGNPAEAYERLALDGFDAILLDLNFTRGQTGGDEGFACLARILGDDPDAAVIVITGHSGIRIAVAAMRAGALDFVMKPWRNAELIERVRAAIAHRRRRAEIATLRREAAPSNEPPRLIGASPAIERVRELIRRIGPTTASVLVRGPSGSGRTLVAQALHHASARAGKDMIALDARVLVDPGDEQARATLAQTAGGTLLVSHADRLDEVGQGRLLDRLPADARLIATVEASEALIPALHGRLGTIEIAVPPLVERGNDGVMLAHHFARLAERRHARPVTGFTPEAEAAILARCWPDEVRGLARAVERAVLLDEDGVISPADLGVEDAAPAVAGGTAPLNLNLERSERVLVETALKRHGFNVSHAAAELGLSRAALYRRMAKHGL